MEEAFVRLTKLVEELPQLTEGRLTNKIIPKAGFIIGPYDVEFTWAEQPDEKMIRLLIFNIDEVLKEIGCRYRITTIEDGNLPISK
jgi:hypothetical protein